MGWARSVGRDTKLDREVAVKFLRFPDGEPDRDLVHRFVREFRITARLVHPAVPAVHDVGTFDGRPYLAGLPTPPTYSPPPTHSQPGLPTPSTT